MMERKQKLMSEAPEDLWEKDQAVKCETCGGNNKVRALWSPKEAKDKGVVFYDLGSVEKILTISQVRIDLQAIHLESPSAVLAKALDCTEQGGTCTFRGE